MAKRKQKPDETQDQVIGHDPFESLDTEWLNREEGELTIQVLGQDPFEDMDVDWMYQEDEDAGDKLLLELAQQEVAVAPGGIEAGPVPSIPVPGAAERADAPAFEQIVVEKLPLDSVFVEAEPPLPPQPPEPIRPAPPVGVVATRVAKVAAEREIEEKRVLRPRATFHFPADFKWGVATAAHQVEGENIHNDWWAWEQTDGHINKGHTSGLACDWWRNAEADFDRAAAMGLNALRLSVEWSRIEPRPGVFDDSALERYGQMLRGLHERGIEPMVTLHHFSNPRWLAEQGGWEAPETIPLFTRFVRRVVDSLGKYCDIWCTINEPNVYGVLGYLEGVFPPGKSDLKTALRIIRNMLTGHAAAYREIHNLQPEARVGLAHHMRVFDPINPRSPLDRRVARSTDKVFNQAILTALTRGRWTLPLGFGLAWKLRHTLDWIGLNYYTRDMVAFDRTQSQMLFGRRQHADGGEMLDGGYGEFYPRGMFRCLQRLARLGLPIYVTENGIPDADDDQRPRYLLAHLHQVWHAIQLCYPVMGYYHWTLVDNFEWAEGWSLRFGLLALDTETQVRTPRRSADLYAETVRANAITPHIIDTYAPELRAALLPG
jgi:beta-glucosidase